MLFIKQILRPVTLLPLLWLCSCIFQLTNATTNCNEEIAIRMTLASLALLVDTKQFSSLYQIFTEDVVADYGYPVGVLNGVPAVEAGLTKLLSNLETHHALSQSIIYVSDDAETQMKQANVTTYFTLPHFGTGKYHGQLFTSWGRYEDVMVQGSNVTDDGQDGWLIKYRKIIYMGPFIGNTNITGH